MTEEQVIAKYLVTNIRKLRERKARALEILNANSRERGALERIWREQLLRDCVRDLLMLLDRIVTEQPESYDWITQRVKEIMGERL